jgi:hypothetical protein
MPQTVGHKQCALEAHRVVGVAGEPTADSRALFEAGRQFLFDAARLLAAVRDGSHATRLDGITGLTTDERSKLVDAGNALLDWFSRTYAEPAGEPSAWRPDTLGYAFGCTADQMAVRLDATDHRGGELDWYAFDVAAAAGNGSGSAEPPAITLSFLPAAIRFPGAPNPRHWEIEDRRTDYGALDVNPSDLARLLLAEFVLLFSNDWCLVPLELEVGSFSRIEGLLVTDVFGDRTLVRAADRGADSDWQRWSMYRLDGDDSARMGLLLAPALTARIEATPLEEVHFLRDEMANMVWAVEHRLRRGRGSAARGTQGHPRVPARALDRRRDVPVDRARPADRGARKKKRGRG